MRIERFVTVGDAVRFVESGSPNPPRATSRLPQTRLREHGRPLLDGHALGEIARLVYVGALGDRGAPS